MENFPGGFPGLYTSESHNSMSATPTSIPSSSSLGTQSSDETTSQTTALNKCIKSRKKGFKNELTTNFDLICYSYFIICYLYDCSLMVLITRSMVQLVSIPTIQFIQVSVILTQTETIVVNDIAVFSFSSRILFYNFREKIDIQLIDSDKCTDYCLPLNLSTSETK